MNELCLPAKCLLMGVATLMIGFPALGRSRGSDASSAHAAPGAQSLTYSALNFISWPKESFSDPASPLVIGVLGTPSSHHDELLAKYSQDHRVVQRRRVEIVRFESPEKIADCHVLFVARSCTPEEVVAALSKVGGKSVLTVGESAGFATAGGVMNFAPGSKGRDLELNLRAAERQRLKIDGRLEALAKTVEKP